MAQTRLDHVAPDPRDGHDHGATQAYDHIDVVPETPETIDNSVSPSASAGADDAYTSVSLEDILALVHREPVLDFLCVEDLLRVGACDRRTLKHVQIYLSDCGNEAFFGIFDLVKYFLQVNVILRIRKKMTERAAATHGAPSAHGPLRGAPPVPGPLRGAPPVPGPLRGETADDEDDGLFYERRYVVSYVTGAIYMDGPLNPIAPSNFSTDYYFVNYLRQLYPTHQKRNWHFPFPDNNELFKDFNHFMRTQLTNLDPLFLKLPQFWWWNKRFEYIWSFMHQPICGFCGDNMNLNARKAKTICTKCEDPDCRTIGSRVIVCGPCMQAQKERVRRERREEQQRRWVAEMEERRRQIDRQRRERYIASKKQKTAPRSPVRRLRFDADDDLAQGQAQAQAQGPGRTAEETSAATPAYECRLADADCAAYGHQGQQCPCECHTNAPGFFQGDAA